MTANGGNLSSYFNLSNPHLIIVGNGTTIPIQVCGHAILPDPFPLCL